MRLKRSPMTRMGIQLSIEIALAEAKHMSRLEPHKVFWLHAIKCPGCNRHAMSLALSSSDAKKPKYVLCTVANGEIIPRANARH